MEINLMANSGSPHSVAAKTTGVGTQLAFQTILLEIHQENAEHGRKPEMETGKSLFFLSRPHGLQMECREHLPP